MLGLLIVGIVVRPGSIVSVHIVNPTYTTYRGLVRMTSAHIDVAPECKPPLSVVRTVRMVSHPLPIIPSCLLKRRCDIF